MLMKLTTGVDFTNMPVCSFYNCTDPKSAKKVKSSVSSLLRFWELGTQQNLLAASDTRSQFYQHYMNSICTSKFRLDLLAHSKHTAYNMGINSHSVTW
jgi:hypothetical protein